MNPLASWQQRAHTLAGGSAVALGFVLPISTAASNLLLALALLGLILGGGYRAHWQRVRHQPAAWLAIALCLLAAVGCLWGLGDAATRQFYLGKYLTLLLIPLLLPLFAEQARRRQALMAFLAGMLLTLGVSVLLWLDALTWLPEAILSRLGKLQDARHSLTQNAVVFKLSITHGFFMALAAFMLWRVAATRELPWQRTLLRGLALLAAANVLFMIIGRTGYVVLALLAGYLFLSRWQLHAGRMNRRQSARLVLLSIVLMGAITTVLWQSSGSFQARLQEAYAEARAWQPQQGNTTSIGLRLDYWRNSLAIIAAQPLNGVGTGGFAAAYDQQIVGTTVAPSNNPHNQYLLTTTQLGLPGLLLLLTLHLVIWREAGRRPPLERDLLRGLLLAYLAGNLFNSFLFDFSERYLFAWFTAVLLATPRVLPAARSAGADPLPSA